MWEALARAHKGDLATADRLYLKLADDPKAEPLIRGVALFSLAGVRHAAQDGPGLERGLDKLVALFPGLNAPDWSSSKIAIDWYRQQARQMSSPNNPAVPTRRASPRGVLPIQPR